MYNDRVAVITVHQPVLDIARTESFYLVGLNKCKLNKAFRIKQKKKKKAQNFNLYTLENKGEMSFVLMNYICGKKLTLNKSNVIC